MKNLISTGIIILISIPLYSQLWQQFADSANYFRDQKNTNLAIEYYIKAKVALRKNSFWTMDNARITTYLGNLYKDLRQYENAEPLYLDVRQIEEKLGKGRHDYAIACNNLGLLYKEMRQFGKAEQLLVEAKQAFGKALGKEYSDYANTCSDLASVYSAILQYEKAESLYLEAKQIIRNFLGTESPDYASYCLNLALLYIDMGQFGKAEPLLLEARRICEKVLGKNHPDYTLYSNGLGILYGYMGEYEKAELLLLESLKIRKTVFGKEHPLFAQSCNNLAFFYEKTGEYEKSEPLYQEAKQVYENTIGKDNREYPSLCDNFGNLYLSMGEFQKAEELLVESKQIREKVVGKKHPDYASSCNDLARLYDYMWQFEKAEPLYLEALQIAADVFGKNHPDYATYCNNLAALYQKMGEYQKAEPLYLEAKQIQNNILGKDHPDYARSCNNLAFLYQKMRQYAKAEPLYLEAQHSYEKTFGKQHPDYAISCGNLGSFYWLIGQPLMAEKQFEESFSVRVSNMNSFFKFTNEKEKTTFIKNVSGEDNGTYSFYVSEKLTSGQPYSIALFHRNLILSSLESLQRQLYYTNDTSLINKYDEWINLKKHLSALYSEPILDRKENTSAIEEKADQMEKDLARLSSAFKKQWRNADWKEIQNKLKADEASIEFASFDFYNGKQYTDSVFYVAILLRNDILLPKTVFLFTERQLIDLFASTGNKITNDGVKQLYNLRGITVENSSQTTNKSVYELIWKPLEIYLKGIKTIYFAPAGLLHKIAFAALPINTKQLLSDKYKLIQLASTASITNGVETTINFSDKLQLYGGINYDADSTSLKKFARLYPVTNEELRTRSIPDNLIRSGAFINLPGTKAEIDAIQKEAKGTQNQTTTLSGNNATEESFKSLEGKASPSVIHIATHGFFFPDPREDRKQDIASRVENSSMIFKQSDNPLFRSGILFAGANIAWTGKSVEGIDDGILTAYEVSNMYLPNTKLVVLSACETALGDIQGSEGVYGLQRAFKIAGVPNLVMSLWKVPDAETAEFMQLLYRYIFARQSISEAFYHAQTFMKNKYRENPYKWAAWVLIR